MTIYIIMVDSYNELGPLTHLVGQIAICAPVKQLANESFLHLEVERIKRRVLNDVLIFNNDFKFYLRDNLKSVNSLIISVLEILDRLPEVRYMHQLQRSQYEHCHRMREVLYELQKFFQLLLTDRPA